MRVAVVGDGPAGSTAVITLKILNDSIRVSWYRRSYKPRGICAGGLGFYALNKIKSLKANSDRIGNRIYKLIESTRQDYIYNANITAIIKTDNKYYVDTIHLHSYDFRVNKLGIIFDRKKFDYRLSLIALKLADELIIGNYKPKQIANKYDYVVDARGVDGAMDYYNLRDLESLYQWYTIPNDMLGMIEIIFDRTIIRHGYIWKFSGGNTVKVGFGEKYINRKHIEDIKNRVYSEHVSMYYKVVKTEAMYLPLDAKIRLFDEPNILRAGTSAGLVDPITGAGIRYAIESGFKVAKAIAKYGRISRKLTKYMYMLSVYDIIFQIKLLNKIKNKLTSMTDEEFMKNFYKLKKYKPKTTNVFWEVLKAFIKIMLS